MADEHSVGGRAREDEYFRRLDRELLERARRASMVEQERQELGAKTGLEAADVQALQALGFTPETVTLLPLVPLVQVAWAEGGVTADERAEIVQLARARGIEEGSAADQQLATWFATRPSDAVFAGASRLLGAMLGGPASVVDGLSADELVEYCERIAAASGGFLGLRRVAAEERTLLSKLAHELKERKG